MWMSDPLPDGVAEKWVRERYLVPYETHVARQGAMLKEIISLAVGSSIYKGRLVGINHISSLSDLPVTSYSMIDLAMREGGKDSVLTGLPERYFHTSGSTGSSKRFYYSANDIVSIIEEYLLFTHMIGIDKGHKGWNFGGKEPLVSGLVLDLVAQKIPLKECVTTLLGDDSDLIRSLKRVSKEDNLDVMASAAIVYYIIARIVRDPDYLASIVRHRVHDDYKVPSFLSGPVARLYLAGLDHGALKRIAEKARFGISYAEALGPYARDIRESFPNIRMHDVYGSTENPLIAAQLTPDSGLSVFLFSVIPEIADPKEVLASRNDPGHRVVGVPWYRWEVGLRGELLITRRGDCLPLVRYPTGDIVEVIDPAARSEVRIGDGKATVILPQIKVLGRSVDVLDFEVEDEMGNFLGSKIYSRHINDAMQSAGNVRWWELYNVRTIPARMVFLIIPEKDVAHQEKFGKEVLHHLLRECDDLLHTLKMGHDLGQMEVKVCGASAYKFIQEDIDRRMREGRSLGQMKPKHIITVGSEAEFETAVRSKLGKQ